MQAKRFVGNSARVHDDLFRIEMTSSCTLDVGNTSQVCMTFQDHNKYNLNKYSLNKYSLNK